jgi:hypothetical protein
MDALRSFHRNVHIFKNFPARDAQALARFDHVIAGAAVVLVPLSVRKRERLGQLLGSNYETSAVGFPIFGHGYSKYGSRLLPSAVGLSAILLRWSLVVGPNRG